MAESWGDRKGRGPSKSNPASRKRLHCNFCRGNGQAYVTTDFPSVQRVIEVHCDALLVAKQGVDGVLNADPKLDKDARKFRSLHSKNI